MATIAHRRGTPGEDTPSLLRLYPAAWRARYGDEFAELLASRPPRLSDQLDILLGALDARINPQLGAAPASELALPGDRSVRGLTIVAGVLLTAWAAIGVSQVGRWDSPMAAGQQALLNVAWVAGLVGSILITIALLRIALRFDQSIGSAGAVGAVLTGSGLLFSSFGAGIVRLAALGLGTALLARRLHGRLLGTVPVAVLAGTTAALIAAMLWFAGTGGQDVGILWIGLSYGPAWVLVGARLRTPAPQLTGA